MGLFDIFKQKPKLPKAKIEWNAFDHTGREVEPKEQAVPDKIYPLEYYEVLREEVQPLESEMVGFASSLSSIKGIDERIKALNSLVAKFFELKSKCISLGPDYDEYFSRRWEHCHNSKNPDFSYIVKYQDELEHLLENRESLLEKEALYNSAANGLEEKLLTVLRDNPVILQTDIYKKFDPIIKSDIQSLLYSMEKDGIITRTKSGRTYEVEYITREELQ